MSHLESLEVDRGRTITSITVRLPHIDFDDRFLEVRIGYHDEKFDCQLWEMNHDCVVSMQGRFVFPEFPCWDSDGAEKRFFDEFNKTKVHDPHSYVIVSKENPTLEERLPSDLAAKVDIRRMKKLVFDRFTSGSPIYQIMTRERDELMMIEFELKFSLWFNLLEMSQQKI